MLESEIEAALLEAVEPVKPPAVDGLLARARTADRLAVMGPKLGALFGLSDEATAALLTAIRTKAGLIPGPGRGVRFLPVEGLAKCVLFVDGDGEFPSHVHTGDETLLVLEGALRDSAGLECWRGDAVTLPEGSEHSVQAVGGVPCICAVLTHDSRLPPHL